jgi:hypothetical protein
VLSQYERRGDPLASRSTFLRRIAINAGAALAMTAASLALGMAGYRITEDMSWVDAFANAAMILSGMGPLAPLATTAGKLFAGVYALFSGLLLIFASGILLAPVAHRILHEFHFDDDEPTKSS